MIIITPYIRKIGILLFLFLLGSCRENKFNQTPSISPSLKNFKPVILGEISDDPTEVFESFQGLADYLTQKLNDTETGTGKVEVVPDMKTMAESLKSGKVEVYFDSPYPAFLVSESSKAKPILTRWKGGISSYKSVIITLNNKGIKTINDLQGKTIAFEENFSTSGYMLPYIYLMKQGLTLKEQTSLSQLPSQNEVTYIFSGNNNNSLQWLISDRVDAMAMGSGDFAKLPEKIRQQFIIIAETQLVPRHLVLVSPTLSKERVSKLKTILLEMNTTALGQEVLETFEETTKFTEFPDNKIDIFLDIRPLIKSNLKL